jgi:hypothetical protein
MKKLISLLMLLMLPCWMAFGADTKVTALTANSDPQATDILYMVDDPGGTPLSQKITLANLALNMPDIIVLGSDLSVGAAGVKLTGDGDGALTLLGLGNGSDEDLTINLDDTADTVVVSSSTGVTSINQGAINLTMGDVLTLGDGEVISNAVDDTVLVQSNDASLITKLYSPNTTNGTVALQLVGDAGADATDGFQIINSADGTLSIGNDSTAAGTYITKMTIDSTGAATIQGSEATAASIALWADNGDDPADKVTLSMSAANVLTLVTGAVTSLTVAATGEVTAGVGVVSPYATLTPTAIASLGAATAGKMVMTSDSGNGTDCTTAGGTKQNLCIGDGTGFVLVKAVKA